MNCSTEELHKWEVCFIKGTLEYTVKNILAFTQKEAQYKATRNIPRGSTYTLVHIKDEGVLS